MHTHTHINIYVYKRTHTQAVRVFPEWQLPKHTDSNGNGTALLHMSIAYRPTVGKYPFRVLLVSPRDGVIGTLSSYYNVVPAGETHRPLLSHDELYPDPPHV